MKAFILFGATLFIVVTGAFAIPAYKTYYTELEIQRELKRADAEAARIRIIGTALQDNELYIEYLKAKNAN